MNEVEKGIIHYGRVAYKESHSNEVEKGIIHYDILGPHNSRSSWACDPGSKRSYKSSYHFPSMKTLIDNDKVEWCIHCMASEVFQSDLYTLEIGFDGKLHDFGLMKDERDKQNE